MEKRKLIEQTNTQLAKSQRNESEQAYMVTVNNKDFVVFPGVFSPKYFEDAQFFSKNIPFQKGGAFLEIGCGTGVVAIFGALNGVKKVVATDINPQAVSNTLENVSLHDLKDIVDVRHGDLFEPIKEEKFDQIFWNMPFLYSEQKEVSLLEKSTFDYKDEKKTQFIKEAKNYLSKNGKLYIGYSSNYGDMRKIFDILKKNGYSAKIIAQAELSFVEGVINLELIEAIPNS
jgi:release factor glutamine methyltransferase